MTDENELAAKTHARDARREELRRRIADDVARYLAAGGQVQTVAPDEYRKERRLPTNFAGSPDSE